MDVNPDFPLDGLDASIPFIPGALDVGRIAPNDRARDTRQRIQHPFVLIVNLERRTTTSIPC